MTDLDPMLREAMARVRGPVDTRPSMTDVRRRARRRNQRRMVALGGAMAVTGVATAGLIIRRDAAGPSAAIPADTTSPAIASTTYPLGSTTTVDTRPQRTVDASLVWDALLSARNDPAGGAFLTAPADEAAAHTMPAAEQFGCTTDDCRAMFTYVVWHELAKLLGFGDLLELQAANPNVDFTIPPVAGDVLQTPYAGGGFTTVPGIDETPTTLSLFDGVVLIDGGAPAGAMEDAYQRMPGYNRVIVPSSGKTVEQTMVMPIGDNTALASAVAGVFGIGGLDTWDPSLIGTPIQGMVAVVIGPDYFDRVGAATTTVPPATTTTSIG